jgi:hypothetical protein
VGGVIERYGLSSLSSMFMPANGVGRGAAAGYSPGGGANRAVRQHVVSFALPKRARPRLTEAFIPLSIARRSSSLDLHRQALHRTLASKARSPPTGAQNDVV